MSKYKVAYYIRVSIGEQIKGYSLEGQKSILDSWAKEMNWRWVKTYFEEASAKDLEREKFQEMITDAKNHLFDGILLVDSDRLSRSTNDLLKVTDDLLKHDIKLHIFNLKHIDIYSQQGRFILTNLASFSEFFRKQLSSKIKAGVKQKMKNEWFGQAPFGYTQVSDVIDGRKKNTRLILNTNEQQIINKMKDLRNQGQSYSEIADFLNKEGIPTRFSNNNNKKSWHPSTVRNILVRRENYIKDNK